MKNGTQTDSPLDALIVGGGPAGLSAALILGRCRRRVLVCDAGHPRNEASRAMHGYLSRDGIPPGEFLKIGREQLRKYDTVELRQTTVRDVERQNDRFLITVERGERIPARTVLLASGLVDELPRVEGFAQFYGVSAHPCPYCDGWEHRNQPVAVLGCKKQAADLAIELLLWTDDVILCTDGAPEFDAAALRELQGNGVRVIELPVARLEGTGQQLERIRFSDSSSIERTALFFSPAQWQRSPLAEKLGCSFCEKDGCIQCNEATETSVPGLYAAGNATRGVQLVIAAAAEGARAACAINTALLEVDSAARKLAGRHFASPRWQ